MKTAALVIVFGLIGSLDMPALFKHKRKKELTVYVGILGLAFVLSELHILRVPIWNPYHTLMQIFYAPIPGAGG
jgi:uncharacterized membrane protein YsdA (DUF1294 family)